MCNHRPSGRWARTWSWWLAAFLGSFTALELVGMADAGTQGTLSAHLRHLSGSNPRCRHVHVGRLVMVAFFGWATAHLGWGLFGLDTKPLWRKTDELLLGGVGHHQAGDHS